MPWLRLNVSAEPMALYILPEEKSHKKGRYQHDNKVRQENARRLRDVSHDDFIHLCNNVDELIETECSALSVEREVTC